jgi:hypothetical protein
LVLELVLKQKNLELMLLKWVLKLTQSETKKIISL